APEARKEAWMELPEVGGGEKKDKFESVCAVILAAFAAVLAVTDLTSDKFNDDEVAARIKTNDGFLWYQAKGIKANSSEDMEQLLKALESSGSIEGDKRAAIDTEIKTLDVHLARYKKEQKEILEGSDKVGQANWAQEVDGQLGQVTGAKEWEAQANGLNSSGDISNFAKGFLQLCLVMGAICLVFDQEKLKRVFFFMM